MSVLCIDVGIRNLAMCIQRPLKGKKDISGYEIQLWGVYDIINDGIDAECVGVKKSGDFCGKTASYKTVNSEQSELFYCKTHFPKGTVIEKCNHHKKKLIKDYDNQDIIKKVLLRIEKIYNDNLEVFNGLSSILLELQMSCNPSMKLVSHVIYGKYVDLQLNCPPESEFSKATIKFVRASQKLKAYTGPPIECTLKGEYAKRKWLSIQYTRWILENQICPEQCNIWLPFLDGSKTKADLTDCFLYAVNNIYGLPPVAERTHEKSSKKPFKRFRKFSKK